MDLKGDVINDNGQLQNGDKVESHQSKINEMHHDSDDEDGNQKVIAITKKNITINENLYNQMNQLDLASLVQIVIQILKINFAFRTDEDITYLNYYFRNNKFFLNSKNDIGENGINQCLLHLIYEHHPQGKIIFKQDEKATQFYIILSGSVSVRVTTLKRITANKMKKVTQEVNRLKEDDCFGEMALTSDTCRSATVIADSDTDVAVLTQEHYQFFLAQAEKIQFQEKIRIIRNTPLFKHVINYKVMNTIVANFREQTIYFHNIVYHEKDPTQDFYIIQSGCFKIYKTFDINVKNENVDFFKAVNLKKVSQIATLGPGQSFGQQEILNELPTRNFTVVCASMEAEVYHINDKEFNKKIFPMFREEDRGGIKQHIKIKDTWHQNRTDEVKQMQTLCRNFLLMPNTHSSEAKNQVHISRLNQDDATSDYLNQSFVLETTPFQSVKQNPTNTQTNSPTNINTPSTPFITSLTTQYMTTQGNQLPNSPFDSSNSPFPSYQSPNFQDTLNYEKLAREQNNQFQLNTRRSQSNQNKYELMSKYPQNRTLTQVSSPLPYDRQSNFNQFYGQKSPSVQSPLQPKTFQIELQGQGEFGLMVDNPLKQKLLPFLKPNNNSSAQNQSLEKNDLSREIQNTQFVVPRSDHFSFQDRRLSLKQDRLTRRATFHPHGENQWAGRNNSLNQTAANSSNSVPFKSITPKMMDAEDMIKNKEMLKKLVFQKSIYEVEFKPDQMTQEELILRGYLNQPKNSSTVEANEKAQLQSETIISNFEKNYLKRKITKRFYGIPVGLITEENLDSTIMPNQIITSTKPNTTFFSKMTQQYRHKFLMEMNNNDKQNNSINEDDRNIRSVYTAQQERQFTLPNFQMGSEGQRK